MLMVVYTIGLLYLFFEMQKPTTLVRGILHSVQVYRFES